MRELSTLIEVFPENDNTSSSKISDEFEFHMKRHL
jgi:hypothetical protein